MATVNFTTQEFPSRSNQAFDLADKGESFVSTDETYLAPDKELRRAIHAEELLVGVEKDIREMFREHTTYA